MGPPCRWARILVTLLSVGALLSGPITVADGAAGPSAQTLVEQAIVLYNRGDCTRAVELLRRAVARDPRYVRAHSWLGACYARMGRNADAVAAFRKVVELAPTSEDARLARVWIERLQRPQPTRTPPRPTPTRAVQPTMTYLVTLPAAAGVSEDNKVREVQLFGELYRRALVERRNWWQRRRPADLEWRVVYNLGRRGGRFKAHAGVEDGSPPEFAATFEVRGDGRTLFEGRPKRAGDVPDAIDVDVTGVLQLELIVRGRDALHTRDLTVVWADPHVDPRPGPSPAPSPPSAPAAPPAPSPGTPPSPSPSPGG
jgi:tetratricopeptide (TPR) repeat protein